MQVWFSAQEIADLAAEGMLPGLPTTKMGITKLAARERWQDHHGLARPRIGREGGGGFEYHLDLLPLHARLTYVVRHFSIAAEDIARPPIGTELLSEKERDQRDARLIILRLAAKMKTMLRGASTRAADEYFVRVYQNGTLEAGSDIQIPDWVKKELRSKKRESAISARSIARWRSRAKADANALRVDRAKARTNTGLLDTANEGRVSAFVVALLSYNSHLTAGACLTQCRDRFGDELIDRFGVLLPMPAERMFQRFIARVKIDFEVAMTRITDPDRYRNHYAISGTGAYRHIIDPNQLWQIDASPMDVLCLDGRHSIYVCLDFATRRLIVLVSRTPRAAAVGALMRKAILKWGVAEQVKTDNGSDFVANETVRLLDALDIGMEVCPPYTPEQKGHVERAIKTIQHKLGPLLKGFIGHDVADRKKIEARQAFAQRLGCPDEKSFCVEMTMHDLQAKIDEWLELKYNVEPHEGLGGRTPDEMAERSTLPIRRVNERALDVLLAPAIGRNGRRKVGKKGIEIDRYYYVIGSVLPGTTVMVRPDISDAGRALVFSIEGDEFLGIAVCAELAGVDPQALLQAAREQRKEVLDEQMREAKQELKLLRKGPDLVDRALNVARRDAANREAKRSNVIRLPRREENHSTPQIEAAIEATRPMPVAPQSERAAEIHRQLLQNINAPVLGPRTVPVNPADEAYERYRRARQLEQLQSSGALLDEQDARWLAGYREGPEYSALRLMPEGFDEAMGF